MYGLEIIFGYFRQEALVAASVIFVAMSTLGLISHWCWRALTTASGVFAVESRLGLWTVNWVLNFMLYLVKKESTMQRVGSSWEALVVDACRCSELVCHCGEIVVPQQRVCIHHSERSLPCDNLTCNVIVEMLWDCMTNDVSIVAEPNM